MTERPLSRYLTREVRMDLRELEQAATPGPWGQDYGKTTVAGEIGGGSVIVAMTVDETDAALIAALRNAAPYLLDVVEAARAYQAFLIDVASKGFDPTDFPEWEKFNAADVSLDDALSALDSHLSAAQEKNS